MRYMVVVVLILIGFSGPVFAFDSAPGSFGESFNAEATKIHSSTQIELLQCKALEKIECVYKGEHFGLLVEGAADPAQTSEVSFIAQPGMTLSGLNDPAWILMQLFSPNYDDATKSKASIDLLNALHKTDTTPAMVTLTLGGVRYGWLRMPDGSGDVFRVEDPPSKAADAQEAKVPTAPETTPVAPPQADQPKAEPPTATTKNIVASFSPSDFKVADPADLFVAPRKFVGKPIEVRRFHCYYADVGDYRCVAPGFELLAIFMPDVGPPAEKDRLENDCGAMKVFMTPKCERTLHVVVTDIVHDHIDMRDRVLLRSSVTTILPPALPAAAKKRR